MVDVKLRIPKSLSKAIERMTGDWEKETGRKLTRNAVFAYVMSQFVEHYKGMRGSPAQREDVMSNVIRIADWLGK